MTSTQQDYNQFIAACSALMLKMYASKSDAANNCARVLAGCKDFVCGTPAAAFKVMQFTTHRDACVSRGDAASLSVCQVAWEAFVADLKAKLLT